MAKYRVNCLYIWKLCSYLKSSFKEYLTVYMGKNYGTMLFGDRSVMDCVISVVCLFPSFRPSLPWSSFPPHFPFQLLEVMPFYWQYIGLNFKFHIKSLCRCSHHLERKHKEANGWWSEETRLSVTLSWFVCFFPSLVSTCCFFFPLPCYFLFIFLVWAELCFFKIAISNSKF